MLYDDFVILRKIYENSVRRNDEMEMTKNLYTNVMWYNKIITAEALERDRPVSIVNNQRKEKPKIEKLMYYPFLFLFWK